MAFCIRAPSYCASNILKINAIVMHPLKLTRQLMTVGSREASSIYSIPSRLRKSLSAGVTGAARLFINQTFSTNSTRLVSNKLATKPSFQSVDSNVKKDALIFTYENTRMFRMMTIFGIAQYFCFANFAYFCYHLEGRSTEKIGVSVAAEGGGSGDGAGLRVGGEEERSGVLEYVAELQTRYKNRIAVASFALGCSVLFFSLLYPLRTITRLTLLRGGDIVRLSTYAAFGRTKDYVVPLKDISFNQSRSDKGAQLSMRLRGRWFYYLVDKREGKFHDERLFDFVVGLKRFNK